MYRYFYCRLYNLSLLQSYRFHSSMKSAVVNEYGVLCYPGSPEQRAIERVCVCVKVITSRVKMVAGDPVMHFACRIN